MSNPMTPNMGLVQPVPTVEIGPAYAIEINADLAVLDAHDHLGDGTSGVRLGAASLLIDGDLEMNGHNLDTARSVRMNDQIATLGGAGDFRNLYSVNGDLYYNNSSATPVQITSGGAVTTASANTALGAASASSNTTIDPASTVSLYLLDSTAAAFAMTLPLAASVGRGRRIVMADITGFAATHNITVSKSGSDTIAGATTATLLSAYGGCVLYSDGVSSWSIALTNDLSAWFEVLRLGDAPFAATGNVRTAASFALRCRNAANSADITALRCDGADNVSVGEGTNTATATMTCKSGGTTTISASGGASVACGTNVVCTSSSAVSMVVGTNLVSVLSTGIVVNYGGVTRIAIDGTGLGFYGHAAVAQPTRAGQLTDNTGGSVTSTLAAITAGAGYTQADMVAVKNALASLAAKVNALDTNAHGTGLST